MLDGLLRRDLVTQKTTKLTDVLCLSPQISPGGKWFVCRSLRYDVMRIPIGGGKLSVVVRSGLPASHTVSFSDRYHPAVQFVSPTEMEFFVDDGKGMRRAPWSE